MKRIIALLLALIMALCLCACGATTGETPSAGPADSGRSDARDTDAPAQTSAAPDPRDLVIDLVEKEAVTLENKCEFYLDYARIGTHVEPPAAVSYALSYDAQEGCSYVDIAIAFKNLRENAVNRASVMTGKLRFSDHYEYEGFPVYERDERSNFSEVGTEECAPQTTEYLHYLFSVPEIVETGSNAVEALLEIDGQACRVVLREGETGSIDPTLIVPNAEKKGSGDVALQQAIVNNACVFYVEYAEVTDDVLPPTPTGLYAHYPAESGMKYVDICVAYTSLKSDGIMASKAVTAKLKDGNQTDYEGFSIMERPARNDFTFTNITLIAPLCRGYIHYLFSIPKETADSDSPLTVQLSIDGRNYFYQVR